MCVFLCTFLTKTKNFDKLYNGKIESLFLIIASSYGIFNGIYFCDVHLVYSVEHYGSTNKLAAR